MSGAFPERAVVVGLLLKSRNLARYEHRRAIHQHCSGGAGPPWMPDL